MSSERATFFEQHPDPMWIYDLETIRFLDVNEAAIAKYGYSRDEFLAMTLADIRPPEDVAEMLDSVRTSPDGYSETGLWRHRSKSGKILEVTITSNAADFQGRKARIVAARDMSPLLELEHRARASAEQDARHFKEMFQAIPGKFLVLTAGDHRIVAASDAYLQTVHRRRKDTIGQLFFDLFPNDPEDAGADGAAATLTSLRRVESTGLADVMAMHRYPVERTAEMGGGFADRFWSVVHSPMAGQNGPVTYIVHRAEEMTDLVREYQGLNQVAGTLGKLDKPIFMLALEILNRSAELKAANELLQEQASNLRTAQRLLDVGFWKRDLTTGEVTWSDNLYSIYGVEKESFRHTIDGYLDLIHPEDRTSVALQMEAYYAKGNGTLLMDHRVLRPDGRVVDINSVCEFAEGPNGRVVTGVVQDVTASRAADARLRQAIDMARLASHVAKLGAWRHELYPQKIIFSPETCAILEIPEGTTLSAEEALRFYGAKDAERLQASLAACFEDGTPFDDILQLVTAKGNRAWVRNIGEAERDRHGRIVAIRGAFQDITELVTVRDRSSALAQRLANTLENMGEAFAVFDHDWNYTFVNRQAEQLLGQTRDQLLGRNVWEVFPQGAEAGFKAEFERAVATGKAVRFKAYYPPPFALWTEISAHPIPEGLAIYFRDVTAEQARAEQLRLLEMSVARLNDILIITEASPIEGPEGPQIVFVNDAFVNQTGFSREEAIGATPRILQGPKTQQSELARIRKAMEAHEPIRAELINYTRDGRDYWIEIEINPVEDTSGAVTHMVAVQRDITQRKIAEQALQLSEERFRLVSNASNLVIWDADLIEETIWFNENFEALSGHASAGFAMRMTDWRKLIHPDDVGRVMADLNTVLASDAQDWESEFRMVRADGAIADILHRGHLIRDESGKALRVVGSSTDITAQQEEAARTRQSQKLEAMGQLTGGVAHDFNNLLTIILGNAELLAERTPDERSRKMAEMIAEAAERGSSLTSRLLAFARKQPLNPRIVEVNQLIALMEGMLRRVLTENIHVICDYASDLTNIDIDANQLEVALLNIVINARDAMPNGGSLTIRTQNMDLVPGTSAQADEMPGPWVAISVTDTGTGMANEVAERAFEPFFTTKKDGLGSGLGLSMVYGFVRQSGGQIRVESELGKGTTFRLYFASVQTASPAQQSAAVGEKNAHGTEHILVVEDDLYVREYLVTQLRSLGYQVSFAENGADAYDILLKDQGIDLLLTDVIMPGGMNGRQLADAARVVRPDLKVLFSSGYPEDAIVRDGRLDPGVNLLSKPYRRKQLAAKVRSVLDTPSRHVVTAWT